MSVNTTSFVGNLCADPELRYTTSGKAVVNLRVAVNEYRGPDKDDHVEYFNVVAWEGMAENCAMSLNKGDRVMVTGRLRVRRYETAPGEYSWRTEISADEIGVALRFATVEGVERNSAKRELVPAGGGSDRGDTVIYGDDEPF